MITHRALAAHRNIQRTAILVLIAVAITACQSSSGQDAGGSGKSASLLAMEQVATAAHRCWFASKDPEFRPYRMANELNSFSGRPRFLLVPAGNFEAKPLLVVQAQGSSRKVETFGPLLAEPLGTRISADITRWSSGDSACGRSA
jgi:hypothetical protein